MRALKAIVRKSHKAKARRKDYERRRNINANVPTEKQEVRKEVYKSVTKQETVGYPARLVNRQVRDGDGSPKIEHVGYKMVTLKKRVYRLHEKDNKYKPLKDKDNRVEGMIQYPQSRKFAVKN